MTMSPPRAGAAGGYRRRPRPLTLRVAQGDRRDSHPLSRGSQSRASATSASTTRSLHVTMRAKVAAATFIWLITQQHRPAPSAPGRIRTSGRDLRRVAFHPWNGGIDSGTGWSRTSALPFNKRPLNLLSFGPRYRRVATPAAVAVRRAFAQRAGSTRERSRQRPEVSPGRNRPRRAFRRRPDRRC